MGAAETGLPGLDEVHVWHAELDVAPGALADLERTLEPAERERAGRFHRPLHRDRYVASRAALRRILGLTLGRAPESIRFGAGPHGKPRLEPPEADLRFNLSHAGGHALVAAATGREVGVDLEDPGREVEVDAIVRRFFGPAERAALLGLAEERRRAAFFQAWVRKEAWLKAMGRGLSGGLATHEVPADPRLVAAPLLSPEPGAAPWFLVRLDLVPGFSAALVVEGGSVRVLPRRLASSAPR